MTAVQDASGRMPTFSGSYFDVGFQHGAAFAGEIKQFLAEESSRVALLSGKSCSLDDLAAIAQRYAAPICEQLPDVFAEIEGLSAGAGIPFELACLLQVRREIIGFQGLPQHGDCSTLAAFEGMSPFVAQTVDLPGGVAPYTTVFKTRVSGKPEILMFSLKGLLGYAGINDAGIAIGINMVLAEPWVVGVPPYLTVRRLLECASVRECEALIRRIPHASSRCLTIMDARELSWHEFSAREVRSSYAGELVHTNHFLDASLSLQDRANIIAKNGSKRRLKLLQGYLQERTQQRDDPSIFALLSSHSMFPAGLCVHNEGDLKREESVAALIMRPARGELLVRFGNPCSAATMKYTFH